MAQIMRTRGTMRSRAIPTESEQLGIVVYMHGIGAHPPKAQLKLEWDLALFGRDLGDRSRMAYWADILHGGEPAAEARTLRAKSRNGEINIDVALRRAGVNPTRGSAREFGARLLAKMQPAELRPMTVGKKVLPLPGFLRKPITREFLEAFIGDTAAYFYRPEIRRQIRERLEQELPGDGQPATIVAHSQGSIVTYEVLSTSAYRKLDVIELVTIGSPLGIREVQDLLEPKSLKVPHPPVTRWHNFADPLDPVALDKDLCDEFEPQGFVQDEVILNGQTRRFMEFNPHSAVGYLAHPHVRRVVNDALRLDVMSRFVVARDVASTLGSMPETRHPVLIEVLEPGYRALEEKPEETIEVERREVQKLREKTRDGSKSSLLLQDRINRTEKWLHKIVIDSDAAKIDPLRRFVAAHLTANELREVAANHREMRVYAVWRSSRKAKLLNRSGRVLKADAAFQSFGAKGEDITWAVLDTGVRGDHPHFRNQTISQAWDCTKPGRPVPITPVESRDPDGHGTHVSGIIAGCADNNGPERGIAPSAKLVVYKVLDNKGEGEDAWIIKALDHIAEQNENNTGGMVIHGLNLSLGGPFDATVYGCGFSPICQELRRLWRSGVLVVVACGNEGRLEVETPEGEWELNTPMSIGDPANLEECIAVGSVHADKPHLYGISSFSSRGPTADGRAKPDVVAPGERIRSCNSRYRAAMDNLYYEESGTSMAAPHVSGLLAAFLSVRREFRGRPDEVKKILLSTCTDIGRDRYHQGYGIPNLMEMLLKV